MIPAEWQLRVPEGIDDGTSRAFAALLEERLGGVPIERVLVWHTDTVVEGALAHLADFLSVDMVAHGVEQTRVLLEQAISRLRRLGTPSAVEETLEGLGLGGPVVEEKTVVLRDGSICRDGAHLHGIDGHWARFWVTIEAGEGNLDYPEIVRSITRKKRKSAHLAAIYAYQDPGAAVALATEDGAALVSEGHVRIAVEVHVTTVLATEDGAALATEDGAQVAVVDLGPPVLVGWHRSDVSAYALATEESVVITTESGSPLIMLEAS